MTEVGDQLHIPEHELEFHVGTSSGPGGQNVNRVRTRVTVCFNVARSGALTEVQRERVFKQLAGRINKQGILKVRSQKHRTQHMNRVAAQNRLEQLLAEALEVERPRRKTRSPEAARERRLNEKSRRSRLKRDRTRPIADWDKE